MVKLRAIFLWLVVITAGLVAGLWEIKKALPSSFLTGLEVSSTTYEFTRRPSGDSLAMTWVIKGAEFEEIWPRLSHGTLIPISIMIYDTPHGRGVWAGNIQLKPLDRNTYLLEVEREARGCDFYLALLESRGKVITNEVK